MIALDRPYEVVRHGPRWTVRQCNADGQVIFVSGINWMHKSDADKHAADLNALRDGTIAVGGR